MATASRHASTGAVRAITRWARRGLSSIRVTPERITLIYLALALAALYLSDVLFVRLFEEPVLSEIQALKGLVEIGLTGALLFGLTKRSQLHHRRDAARLEAHRDELNLLHRVLRHNLRNDLNVIYGFAQLLSEESLDETTRAYSTEIISTTERIIDYTEKAHRIRQVSVRAGRRVRLDLGAEIPRELVSLSADDVELTTDIPAECVVEAHPMIPAAVRELVDNAIEHSRGERPRVSILIDPEAAPPGMTRIEISDDGPGIPPTELDPLRTGEETPLEHTSKLGLWFVKWAVDHSDGNLAIETDPDGTTIRITLPTGIDLDFPSRDELLESIDLSNARLRNRD